jgi:O-antigen/teichoic acid export membrane protein
VILKSMGLVSGVNVLKAAVTFLITLVLAGKVSPAEFGLVSFAVPLMAFLTLLTDLGLASAIVRHPTLDRESAGAVLCFLGIAGAVSGLLLAMAAGPVEHAASLPGLTGVLYGFAAVTAASIWAVAPRALLERNLAYTRIVAIEGSAIALALLAFFAAASQGAGVYALVAFHVVLQATRAAALSIASHGLYSANLRMPLVKPLLSVGGWVFGSNLLAFAARNIDRFLIGAVLGSASLGLYGLAYQFMIVPLMLISWPVSGVVLAILSRLPATSAHRAQVISAIVTLTAAVSFPLMALFAFAASYPISTLYGHKWDGLAWVITLLAPIGAIQSIASYAGSVLIAKGWLQKNFAANLIGSLTIVIGFVSSVWFGLIPVVTTYLVTATLASASLIILMCRSEQIRARDFWQWVAPGLAMSLPGIAAAMLTSNGPTVSLTLWLACIACFSLGVIAGLWCFKSRLETALKSLTQLQIKQRNA